MGFEQSYAAWFFGRSSEKWSKCVSYNFFPGEQLRLFELGKSEYRRSAHVGPRHRSTIRWRRPPTEVSSRRFLGRREVVGHRRLRCLKGFV